MAVAFDAVGPSSAGAASATTPITWSHTDGSGVTAIVAGLTTFTGGTNAVTSVSYGGNALALQGFQSSGNVSSGGIALYELDNPPSGANSFSAAFTGASDTIAGSMSFTGSSGKGTPVTAFAVSVTSVSVTVPNTTTGGMIAVVVCEGSGAANNFVGTNSVTVQWQNSQSNSSAADNAAGGTVASTGGGASQTVGFSGQADDWALVAVELLPAGGATAPGIAPAQQYRRRSLHGRNHFIQQPTLPNPASSSVTINGTIGFSSVTSLTELAVQNSQAAFAGVMAAFAPGAQQQAPVSLAGNASLAGVTVQGSGTAFGGQATLAPTAIQGSSVAFAGQTSWLSNAVQIAGTAFNAASSAVFSGFAGVSGVISIAASSVFNAVANQIAPVSLPGSATFTESATQNAGVTMTGASSFTTLVTQIATNTFNAASSLTAKAVQIAGLVLNTVSSIVLNAGGSVTGTIAMAANAAWQSSAVQNAVTVFSGGSQLTTRATIGAVVAFNTAASLAGNVVQGAKASFNAAAVWTGRLLTGILSGRSKAGGRDFGSRAGGFGFGSRAGSSRATDSSISGDEN